MRSLTTLRVAVSDTFSNKESLNPWAQSTLSRRNAGRHLVKPSRFSLKATASHILVPLQQYCLWISTFSLAATRIKQVLRITRRHTEILLCSPRDRHKNIYSITPHHMMAF